MGLPLFSRVTVVVATFLIVLIIFWAGTIVGHTQAQYSYRWSNHYADNFGGPRSPFAMMRPDADHMDNANGAAGIVVAVNLPTIAVKGPNEVEKVIVIDPKTVIRRFRDLATSTDIRVGDMLVAIGSSNEQGQIAASFVRLMATSSNR